MAIPEAQLETWSHQGSIIQSSETYATVKAALESPSAAYAVKDVSIFLQGSYGNDTNIWADSDVDVVIQLNSAVYYDDGEVPEPARSARRQAAGVAAYQFPAFKKDVTARLKTAFGDSVSPGQKAIFIPGSGNRRDADVLVSSTYHRYYVSPGQTVINHLEGLCFFTPTGAKIVNYPKLHSIRCTAKHQATNQWFKPLVRIFKNMRNRALADRRLAPGMAPSYFLEGMLHNVPNDQFGASYGQSVVNALLWLRACDRKTLVTASGRHYLLRDGPAESWPTQTFETFLTAMIEQWNGW